MHYSVELPLFHLCWLLYANHHHCGNSHGVRTELCRLDTQSTHMSCTSHKLLTAWQHRVPLCIDSQPDCTSKKVQLDK